MNALVGFAGVTAAVCVLVAGLVVVGLGQVFAALREIAFNTRMMAWGANPSAPQQRYAGLEFIATALTVVGGILAGLGAVMFVVVGIRA